MATTSRLTLYNGALRLLGETPLASLAENREARRMLDAVWDDNVVDRALEAGDWLFATRSMMYDYSPSVEPEFGFRRAFDKPTDWKRTSALASDEFFTNPLTDRQYNDEAGYWYADLDTIYVKYVSNDSAYGGALSRWPQAFVKYVQAIMAAEITLTLAGNKTSRDDMLAIAERQLTDAASKNAMAAGAKFPPRSGWVQARSGGWGRNHRNGQP
jgi:hypothetical protein